MFGKQAKAFTAAALSKPFTIQTRRRPLFGPTPRYYAFVFTTDGKDLAELLVATASRESMERGRGRLMVATPANIAGGKSVACTGFPA